MSPSLQHSPELEGLRGLFHFAADPLGALDEARRLHGPFVRYSQGGQKVYLIMDAELTDELLVRNAERVEKDAFTKALRPILGLGLLTNEGAAWKSQRKLLAPSFQPRHIAKYAEVMVDTTREWVSTLGEDSVRSAHQDMMVLALEIVLRTMFGTKAVRAQEIGHCLEMIMVDYRSLTMTFRAVFPRWFPFYSRIRFGRMRRKLRSIAYELIRNRKKEPLSDDMLSRLLEARDETGRSMSDEQLVDECLTVMLAGHETTALALTYALHTLANRPDLRVALTDELEQVLGGRPAVSADVQNLKVTRGIVRETLRLYSPAWSVGREAVEEVTLGDVQVAAGTQLVLNQWTVHRDERYFREPLEFRPERWWNGETESLPKGAYFPFGGGQRVCIGAHFAEIETVLVLATFFAEFEVVSSQQPELRFSPSVTLRPADDVYLRFRRRSTAFMRQSE